MDSIFEKYLEASGGKSAFEKLTSRVSTGTVEITALGLTGTAELDEQAPNKSSLIIDAPGLGVMQRTFDGSRAWLQDPLQGFIRFTGSGLEMVKADSVFNKQTKLKELYPAPLLIGKEKVGGKDAYVVQMGWEKWFLMWTADCYCAKATPTTTTTARWTASSCPSGRAKMRSRELVRSINLRKSNITLRSTPRNSPSIQVALRNHDTSRGFARINANQIRQ